ncbi:MAG: hypothetical protein DRZ76_02800 [Candidatus Nealsonbacteria bacterium]|nr:MAG: hypothetical protein DRZ76_02800 [Candidatus Nealsonbacteria bacterium]
MRLSGNLDDEPPFTSKETKTLIDGLKLFVMNSTPYESGIIDDDIYSKLDFSLFVPSNNLTISYWFGSVDIGGANFDSAYINLSIYNYSSDSWELLNGTLLDTPSSKCVNVIEEVSGSNYFLNGVVKLRITIISDDPSIGEYATRSMLCGDSLSTSSALYLKNFTISSESYPTGIYLDIGNDSFNNFISTELVGNYSIQRSFNDSKPYKELIGNNTIYFKIPKNSSVSKAYFDLIGMIQSPTANVNTTYSGSGTITLTFNITDSEDSSPIEGARCHLASVSGGNPAGESTSNSNGLCSISNLDASTFYYWYIFADGYTSKSGSVFTDSSKTLSIQLDRSSPFNPAIILDNSSGVILWNYSGLFVGNNVTSDFSSVLNNYLNTCSSDSEGYCTIPLVIRMENYGKLGVGIRIKYDCDLINASQDMSSFLSSCSPGTCSIPYLFHSNTAGKIEYSNLEVYWNESVPPSISYNTNSDNSGVVSKTYIFINVSSSDDYLDSVMLEFNGVNETFDNSGNGNYWENKTGLGEGTYTFYAWANDTFGNYNFLSSRVIIVDLTSPLISYNPNSDTSGDYSRDWIFVNITASDTHKSSVVLEFDGVNETFDNNVGDIYWENKTGLPDGTYTIKAYINDSAGNTNSTETRTITLDTTSPTLTITNPTIDIDRDTSTMFNISSDEPIDTCLISFDGGSNITMDKYSNNLGAGYINNSMTDKNHTILFYCNDSVGNFGSATLYLLSDLSTITTCRELRTSRTYILQKSISTTGDCFDVNNDSIIVDMNGYNISGDGETGDYGFDVSGYNNITIKNGKIYNFGFGIYFLNSDNGTITNMTVTSCSAYGFYGELSSNNNITHSNLSGNGDKAIYIVTSSKNNIILNTTYSLNKEFVGGISDLIRKWYYRAYVNDTVGNDVYNANVSMFDKNGNLVFEKFTDSGGYIPLTEVTAYRNNAGVRTDYNNFTIKALNYTAPPYVQEYVTKTHNLTAEGNIYKDVFTLTYDIIPPSIDYGSGTEPNNKEVNYNWIFINISLTEDNLKNITYTLKNSSGIVNQTTYTSQITSINFTSLADGIYTYWVNVTDKAENKNSTEVRTITLDTTPPSISIQEPKTQNYNNNDSMALNYTVSDTLAGVDSCWYKVVNSSGGLVIDNTTIPSCVNTTFSLPGGDVDYTLTLYSNDTLGNLGDSSVSFGIRTTAPAISLDYPLDGVYLDNGTQVYFNFTATDSDGLDVCELYGNWTGTWSKNYTWTSVTSGVQNYVQRNLPESNGIVWNVWCNDSVGNEDWGAENKTMNVDLTDPHVEILTADGVTITGLSFTFLYNISDLNIQRCSFTLRNSTGDIHNYDANTSLDCNQISRSISTFYYGNFTLRIWGIDKAGRISTDIINFTTKSPTIPTIPGGGGSTTVIGPGEIQWSVTTTGGGNKYEIVKVANSKRTFDLLLENTGDKRINIYFECRDVVGKLCKNIKFEKEVVDLPVTKGIKVTNSFTISFPEEISDKPEIFNIYAVDQYGNSKIITVETRTVSPFSLAVVKLSSSRDIKGVVVPYLIIFLACWMVAGVSTHFLILKNKPGFAILIGMVVGFVVVMII